MDERAAEKPPIIILRSTSGDRTNVERVETEGRECEFSRLFRKEELGSREETLGKNSFGDEGSCEELMRDGANLSQRRVFFPL